MSPSQGNQTRETPRPDSAEFSTSRRVAVGTFARSVGEVFAKFASIALYVAIARELGDQQFGDVIYGISLSSVLLLAAGIGTEELITREVARDRDLIHSMFRNVLAVKTLLLVVLWLVMVGIVAIQGYSTEVAVGILLVGAAVGIEYQTKTFYAVFQAYESMQYIAASLVLQRILTAAVGIAVLIAGGGILEVGIVFVGGSLVGLASAYWWMHRKVVRPKARLELDKWMPLLRASAPLGLVTILYLALVRLDATLLSFLSGGDNTAVGHYGAAYRLIDATMFVSAAFGAAIMPWFSRHDDSTPISLQRGYELGLKAMVALLLPIGMFYVLFASPLIEILYGQGFEDAVTPLRLLAGMTVLYGINTFVSIFLIARDRPRAFIRPAVIVLVQNVIFNLILIPEYGASGAAFNAVLSGALLAALTVGRQARSIGGISPFRVAVSPLIGTAAMTAAALGLWELTGSWLLGAIASALGYAAGFLAAERLFFPGDFRFVRGVVKRGREDPPGATEDVPDLP